MSRRAQGAEMPEVETPEAPVTPMTVPASRTLLALLARIEAAYQREVTDALRDAAEEANLPPTAQLDPRAGVWVLPADVPSAPAGGG